MKIVCQNKKANFEYEILDKYEAGIVLTGDEIKSVRAGNMSINESFCQTRNENIKLKNAYIKAYENSYNSKRESTDERKDRILLLHKKEIERISEAIEQKGLTIVPTKAYFDKKHLKIEIAIARGKKNFEKKQTVKERDIDRNTARILKDY